MRVCHSSRRHAFLCFGFWSSAHPLHSQNSNRDNVLLFECLQISREDNKRLTCLLARALWELSLYVSGSASDHVLSAGLTEFLLWKCQPLALFESRTSCDHPGAPDPRTLLASQLCLAFFSLTICLFLSYCIIQCYLFCGFFFSLLLKSVPIIRLALWCPRDLEQHLVYLHDAIAVCLMNKPPDSSENIRDSGDPERVQRLWASLCAARLLLCGWLPFT